MQLVISLILISVDRNKFAALSIRRFQRKPSRLVPVCALNKWLSLELLRFTSRERSRTLSDGSCSIACRTFRIRKSAGITIDPCSRHRFWIAKTRQLLWSFIHRGLRSRKCLLGVTATPWAITFRRGASVLRQNGRLSKKPLRGCRKRSPKRASLRKRS